MKNQNQLKNQNQRLERLIRGLRNRTLTLTPEDSECNESYRAMCGAIDDYRCAGKGIGDADFGAVLDAIAGLIEAHSGPLAPSEARQEVLDRIQQEGGERYTRMEQRFQEVMRANDGTLFHLAMGPLQVGIVHGCIRLSATHPDVKKLSPAYQKATEDLRYWCKEFYREMGFTDEEVEYLDTEEGP